MITYIINKAKELGAQNCNNCHELDYGFALSGSEGEGGKCINCSSSVKQYSPEKTLQFSLLILKELLQSNDDCNTISDKQYFISKINDLALPLMDSNSLPANEEIIKFQALLKSIPKGMFGSEDKIGGVVTLENGKWGLALGKTNLTMGKVKSLTICALSIYYIMNFKVKNEFVL